jgi:Putative transposase DNA-binding domain
LAICQARNVEVVILNRGEDTTFEQDFAKDVLEIITVFSAAFMVVDRLRTPSYRGCDPSGAGYMLIAHRIALDPHNKQRRYFARAARDVEGAFFEFRRQLDYKSRLYGSTIVVADRWFPSSKICSCCGVVKDTLDLNERTFRCGDCGFECDRDLNAARNLEKYAESFAALKAATAAVGCGEGSAGSRRRPRVKLPSAKQLPDINAA